MGDPVYIVTTKQRRYPFGVYSDRKAAEADERDLQLLGEDAHIIVQQVRDKPQGVRKGEG